MHFLLSCVYTEYRKCQVNVITLFFPHILGSTKLSSKEDEAMLAFPSCFLSLEEYQLDKKYLTVALICTKVTDRVNYDCLNILFGEISSEVFCHL